jgi:acetyl esterase
MFLRSCGGARFIWADAVTGRIVGLSEPPERGNAMASVLEDFTVREIEYLRHGDRGLPLRLFSPAASSPAPLVIVLHPGGWAHGDMAGCDAQGAAWAKAGFAVASLEFRQGTDRYPSSLVDINYAVRWAKAHAAELGIDAARIALSGFSSGGHLALLAAMRPDDPRYAAIPVPGGQGIDARVRCVAAAWPVGNPLSRYRHTMRHLDGEAAARWVKLAPEPYHAQQGIIDNHHLYWTDEAEMAEGSPLLKLERGEAVATPPVLWVQGDPDIVHDYPDPDGDGAEKEPERFARLYRAAGGEIDLRYVDYATKMDPPSFDPMAAFFRARMG